MGVPLRRGVLLHGPPGNGKTSLIRHIGARLPHVPALLLRPAADFDSDDLEEVIRRWSEQAPAILVIEDLNWLLVKVNVSTFLNLLDGVDRGRGKGGLLLIATTNSPDQLDPAVNNRPGRFDVVLEVPPPDRALRLEFLCLALATVPRATLETLAARTDGLSFAHLQEIVRLSGLTAIHAGRQERTEKDLSGAADTVRRAFDEAVRGFPVKPELPFGLLPLRDRK
jgi:ATP-dependent 26S proteasome regulatory subunit